MPALVCLIHQVRIGNLGFLALYATSILACSEKTRMSSQITSAINLDRVLFGVSADDFRRFAEAEVIANVDSLFTVCNRMLSGLDNKVARLLSQASQRKSREFNPRQIPEESIFVPRCRV